MTMRRPVRADAIAASTMVRLMTLPCTSPSGTSPWRTARTKDASDPAISLPTLGAGAGDPGVPSRSLHGSWSPSHSAVPAAPRPASRRSRRSRRRARTTSRRRRTGRLLKVKTAAAAASPRYQDHDGSRLAVHRHPVALEHVRASRTRGSPCRGGARRPSPREAAEVRGLAKRVSRPPIAPRPGRAGGTPRAVVVAAGLRHHEQLAVASGSGREGECLRDGLRRGLLAEDGQAARSASRSPGGVPRGP